MNEIWYRVKSLFDEIEEVEVVSDLGSFVNIINQYGTGTYLEKKKASDGAVFPTVQEAVDWKIVERKERIYEAKKAVEVTEHALQRFFEKTKAKYPQVKL